MPVIPTYEAKANLDPDQAPRVQYDSSEFTAAAQQGRALEGLGSSLGSLGGRLQRQAGDAPAQTAADPAAPAAPAASVPAPADATAAGNATTPGNTLRDTWAYKQSQAANFQTGLQDDARRQAIQDMLGRSVQAMPANGAGFHDAFMAQADQAAKGSFEQMPAGPARDQAIKTWTAERDGWSTKAAQIQVQKEAAYSQQQIGLFTQNSTDEVTQNPGAMGSILATGRQRIADAPGLTAVDRAVATQAFDRNVLMTGLAAKHPNDPDGLRAELGLLEQQGLPSPAGQGGVGSDAAATARAGDQRQKGSVRSGIAPDPASGIGSDVTIPARNPAFSNAVAAGRAGQAMAYFQSQGWSQDQAAGIVGNLTHESGGLNTAARNAGDGSDGSDSIGLGQWNGQRGRNLAAFAAQHGTDATDFATQLAFVQHELTGTEGKAGAALKTTTNVRDATAAVALKYERPAGSNTGVAENASGWNSRLRNAVALAGGQFPAANPSGTPHAHYSPLSDQDTQQLIANAEAGRSKAIADRQQVKTLAAIDMAHAVDSDVAAVQSNGQGSADLEVGRVAAILGPQAAQDWAARRADALDVYRTTAAMPTMTNEQLEQAVDARHPGEDDTSDDYPRKAWIYVGVHGAAQKILEARTNDPAGAVNADPHVEAARQQFKPGGSYEGVVQARLAAQAALGILPDARSPITADEAQAYAAQMVPKPGQDPAMAADTVVQSIGSQFGRYAGPVLSRVLFAATGKRDVSDVLGAALMRARSTDAGPMVRTAEGARLSMGVQADTMARNTGADLGSLSAASDPRASYPAAFEGATSDTLATPPARKGSYLDAVDALQKDPDRLMPFFVQRYGADRVPATLRSRAGAAR